MFCRTNILSLRYFVAQIFHRTYFELADVRVLRGGALQSLSVLVLQTDIRRSAVRRPAIVRLARALQVRTYVRGVISSGTALVFCVFVVMPFLQQCALQRTGCSILFIQNTLVW